MAKAGQRALLTRDALTKLVEFFLTRNKKVRELEVVLLMYINIFRGLYLIPYKQFVLLKTPMKEVRSLR